MSWKIHVFLTLRPFGCNVWVHVPDEKQTKFESKTKHHILLGYVERATNIWRVWDPESQRQTVATNCIFDESSFGMPNERDSVFTVVPDLSSHTRSMDKKAAKALSPAAQLLLKSTALVGRYSKVESLTDRKICVGEAWNASSLVISTG